MGAEELQSAWELLKEAYQYQMGGDYDMAVELYKRSLDLHPTAEAYTFLGWTYHHQGKTDKAIAECKKAIALDPDFGNPYNDIGAYLIEQGRHHEAVEWLEKAIRSKRYASYHYPHYNLGRVCLAQDRLNDARRCFERALELAPDYTLAREALKQVRRKLM
jgi:Tfp pilus assembly protein PilF